MTPGFSTWVVAGGKPGLHDIFSIKDRHGTVIFPTLRGVIPRTSARGRVCPDYLDEWEARLAPLLGPETRVSLRLARRSPLPFPAYFTVGPEKRFLSALRTRKECDGRVSSGEDRVGPRLFVERS